jgi:hypothetical protein
MQDWTEISKTFHVCPCCGAECDHGKIIYPITIAEDVIVKGERKKRPARERTHFSKHHKAGRPRLISEDLAKEFSDAINSGNATISSIASERGFKYYTVLRAVKDLKGKDSKPSRSIIDPVAAAAYAKRKRKGEGIMDLAREADVSYWVMRATILRAEGIKNFKGGR